MKRSKHHSILAWSLGFGLLAGAALPAPAVAAVHREAALGAEGELYQVRAGSYGSLFPKGTPNGTASRTPVAAATPVLALEVSRPGEAPQRLLVPGTDTPDVESSPSLVVEESSNAVFLVWEIRHNAIHSLLKLSSFDGANWSEPIEVGKNPSSLKTAPQLAITRDAYTKATPQGETVTRQRTILHLIWAEEQGGDDVYKTRYTPLVVEKGSQLGPSPVYDLNVYQDAGGSFEAVVEGGPSDLVRTPVIQSGRDGRTVVVAFADAETRRIVTVEIDSLPAELSRLADGARAQIVDLGNRHSYPTNRQAMATMAAQVRTGIVAIGGAFHPEVVQSIAERIHDLVVDSAAKGRNLVSLAEEARAQIVDLGAKLSGRGLRHQQNTSTTAIVSEIVESTFEPEVGTEESVASHLIQFRVASSRPTPQVGGGDIRIFVSENGEQLILAWAQADRVRYRSSQGEGWTDIRELVLSENLTQQKAFEILEQRVRGH